ncbi:MAG: L-threonylcarbamoyladenylate synthase [Patescibacteria group bacterium]
MEILTTRLSDLKKVVKYIDQGQVIIIPTDTAYGLAADPDDHRAVNRLYKIKGRPKDKALPWIAGSLRQVREYFILSPAEEKLADKFWPGPLSMVLRRKGKKERIAIRVPANAIARNICLLSGRPLTATSANLSGKNNVYSMRTAIVQFDKSADRPYAIIAAGRLRKKEPSTIIELTRNRLIIHRPGPVSRERIIKYV